MEDQRRIEGDEVHGDKVMGDKVMGDKIVIHGQEITLPTPEKLAAYRTAVADHYARWDDPRYIQEEGEFLPLFASPYDVVEGPGRERTDLLDAIRDAQKIIVLGEPGMGKTTALERLMLEYARQDDGPLPVFVPLLYYTGDLMESIRTELNRHAAFHLPDEAHAQAFLQGVPCIVMFDGLNEVSGRLRDSVAGEIRQVMSDYPRQRYAVTSRSQDELWQSLRGEDEDLPTVVIREIGDEQVRDYLRGHLGAETGQALYDRLDERMRGLAHNPLLLWMIKEVRTDEAGTLPDNRGRLFDHFVTQMLKREVRLKEWATSVPAGVKRECLAELAYEMFTSERESRLFVASFQAEAVLAACLERRPGARYEVRQVLEESKRNGLLTGEENVRFMHQSVQEFFAALVLKSKVRVDATRTGLGRFRRRVRNAVISRLFAVAEVPQVSLPLLPEWSPLYTPLAYVSFLVLAIIVSCLVSSMMLVISLPFSSKPFSIEELLLMSIMLAVYITMTLSLVPGVIRELFAQFQGIAQLLQHWAIINFRRPVARWLLSFFETCWFVRVADDWWAETFILLAGIADDQSWLVREVARANTWLAYWCLLEGQEVDEEARLAVGRATTEALTSLRPTVRLRAVQALSRIANPRTVEPLINALGDKDEGVARVAQQGLVGMGQAVVERLVEIFLSERGSRRRRVAEVLQAACEFPVDASRVGDFIETLADSDKTVAAIAQQALVQVGEATTNRLLSVISTQASPLRARLRAGNVLGQIGDPRFRGPYLESELITIPAGEFWMGSETTAATSREKPVHKVHIAQFQMAKYPVTNAQFKHFVDVGGYSEERYWTRAGWVWRQGKGEQFGRGHREWPATRWEGGQFPPEQANHPVMGVTWYEALAYTRWLAEVTGKPYRLPTEAEWEKAARGNEDKRDYPWGDTFDPKKANLDIGEETVNGTSPVGIYPGGASPYGIMDMSGNVWEWCSSLHWDYPYDPDDGREDLEAEGRRVLRGGSWARGGDRCARCSFHYGVYASFSADTGLRVVVGSAALSPGSGSL